MRRLTLLLLTCTSLCMPLSDALAGGSFWDTASDQEDKYSQNLREGDEFAEAAAKAQSKANRIFRLDGSERAREAAEQIALGLARRALESYELAVKADPTQVEPHYRAGEVLLAFMIDDNIAPPSSLDRAIEHWRQFERKAPLDPRLTSILDDRSIALTKRGGRQNHLAAIADYGHSLELMDQSSENLRENVARLISNRAELYMMVGDLDRSIEGYERALKFYPDTVYGYGLAVALDRDKQGVRARDTARLYAQTDSRNALQRPGTFFVPQGERFYYIAIRHEGRGDYRAAIKAYEELLRRLPTSPWAKQARANIKDLGPKAAKQPKPKKPKLRKWPF
jgi:tetratricopeptide (TPR) repeat protein